MFNEIVKLFSRNIYITFKFDDTNERRSRITVSVELHNLTSPFPRKELKLRLTDESDLFFYYSLVITEDDYQHLKTSQAILIEFSAFPQQLIDLLELCSQEESKDNPKFILSFSRSSYQNPTTPYGRLTVVETNLFKHLIHLSLDFIQGSDSEVKNYLAVCLQETKDRKDNLEKQLSATENDLRHRLQTTQENLNRKTTEFDRLRDEMNDRMASTTSRLMQEMSEEREKNQQRFNDLQLRFCHHEKCHKLESKITYLESKLSELNEQNRELETTRRDFHGQLVKSEDEVKHLRQEVQNLRYDITILEKNVEDRDKVIKTVKSRNSILEQELKDKVDANNKQLSDNELLQDQRRKLEVCYEEKRADCNKLNIELKELTEDVTKANEIIRKLQQDVKISQGKAKMGSQIALEQEKLIKEKDSFIEKQHRDLASVGEKLTVTETELKDVKEKMESGNEKIEKLEKDLKTNEKVINWLNKQLNDKNTLQQKGAEIARQQQFLRPMHTLPTGLCNSAPPSHQPHAYYAGTLPKPLDFGYFTPNAKDNFNVGKINKENDVPLDGKYFQTKGPKRNDSGKAATVDSSNDKPKSSNQGQLKKPIPFKSNRIPKSDLLLSNASNVPNSKQLLNPPMSAYFPKPATGIV
uniref:Spindle assembly abnormal protein 6 homolog n=1 Tax=Strigamia maritima TaxID=126957 RepID=T1J237_STRMM